MLFSERLLKKGKKQIDESKLPMHIAIIPDGNGRWAKQKGMPRSIGHRQGSTALKEIVKFCAELNIKHLTAYAFSTENWKRPKDEVDSLMDLLHEFLSKAEEELSGSNIRINVIGDRSKLPSTLRDKIKEVEDMTKPNSGLQFNIALNYGGRDEIVFAVKQICKDVKNGKIKINEIDIDKIENNLYTWNIPDPDLIIRTAGEKRISNFLLWQCAYSEFWTCNILWPDFKKKDLLEAIKDYQNRERRYGGV